MLIRASSKPFFRAFYHYKFIIRGRVITQYRTIPRNKQTDTIETERVGHRENIPLRLPDSKVVTGLVYLSTKGRSVKGRGRDEVKGGELTGEVLTVDY